MNTWSTVGIVFGCEIFVPKINHFGNTCGGVEVDLAFLRLEMKPDSRDCIASETSVIKLIYYM